MKTSKKVLTALLAICLNTGTALAEVDKTATTALVADVTSGYTITVPETVALSKSTDGSGTYTGTIPVNLKGSVGSNEKVTVTTTVTDMTDMTDASGTKAPVTFTAKPKTVWSYSDLLNGGTTSNYVVSATLTAGSWKGIATFSCTMS